MWSVTARVILRFRAVFIWLIVAMTFFMFQQSKKRNYPTQWLAYCQVIQKPS